MVIVDRSTLLTLLDGTKALEVPVCDEFDGGAGVFMQLAVIFNCIGILNAEETCVFEIGSICPADVCGLYIFVTSFGGPAMLCWFSFMLAAASALAAAAAAACPNVELLVSGGGRR